MIRGGIYTLDEIKTPPSTLAYRDGFERIFGQGVPEMNDAVKDMLHEWVKCEDYSKIMMFFLGTCDYTEDYSSFLLRELIRGEI